MAAVVNIISRYDVSIDVCGRSQPNKSKLALCKPLPYSSKFWQFAANLLKFYPPTIFILANMLCKAANPPMFCLPTCLLAAICQSFMPYGNSH